MARVTCPECDARTRIPEDHDRSFIRCKECNVKVYLDDEEEEEVKPRKLPRARTLGKMKKARGGGMSGIAGFWPLLLIPVVAVLPCLAAMHRVGGILGIGGGIVMAITGFIMAWMAASNAGLSTVGDLPFILQRIPLVHLFYQIKYAIELPKEAGIWVLLEFLGIGVAITSGVLMEKHDQPDNRRAEAPYIEQRMAQIARIDRSPSQG